PSSTPAACRAAPTARRRSPGTSERSMSAVLVGRGAALGLAVGGDDGLHELVAHDGRAAEPDEVDVLDLVEDRPDLDQTGLRAPLQIDLGDVAGDDDLGPEAETGQEHLHLLGARVLRLVEDHEGIVERPAAHEGQRRHLDGAALEVGVDLLGIEHVVERVEERSQIRIDLRLDVAGKEAQPLARLDRRPSEDHAADVAAREGGGGHRHRQEGLAGAGRADTEGDRVAADRVDVLLLIDGLGRDPRVAVLPDDVLEDLGRALVLIERAGDGLDRARGDLVSLLDQVDQLAYDGLRGADLGRLAVQGEDVAAEVEVDVEVALEGTEDRVLGAGQLRGDGVVDLKLPTRQASRAPPG